MCEKRVELGAQGRWAGSNLVHDLTFEGQVLSEEWIELDMHQWSRCEGNCTFDNGVDLEQYGPERCQRVLHYSIGLLGDEGSDGRWASPPATTLCSDSPWAGVVCEMAGM